MEHASVELELDDSDSSSNVDIKEEPVSEEFSEDDYTGFSDGDVEVKDEKYEPGNVGMAAVMAKILNKTSEGPAIMSKSVSERLLAARKRRHMDNTEPGANIEIVKTESESGERVEGSRKKLRKTKQHSLSMQQKLEREDLCHTLPNPLEKGTELNLIKIATRGVVQLFNAVKQQQGKIRQKVGEVKKSVRKTDKVISQFTSGDFLDKLKSQKVKTVQGGVDTDDTSQVKEEIKEEPTWSALRDDYTMGAQSMKDWDKGDNQDSESAGNVEDTDSEGD